MAARTALVKQLRAAKRRDDATAVAALRRPTPAAWALNLSARREPELVAEVLAAGDDLRAASTGAPGAPNLREADAAHRKASTSVVAAALRLVVEAGATATPDLRQHVADTLRAALADPAVAAELRAGRLQADHVPAGFGLLDGAAGAGPAPARREAPARERRADTPTGPSDPDARRRAELGRALAKAVERRDARREAADEAEAAAAAEADAAEEARREAEAATRRAEQAAARAAHAAEAAARARQALSEAEGAVGEAEAELGAASG